jgi:hypothetical protein
MWYHGLGLPNFGGTGLILIVARLDWFSSKLDGDQSAKGLLGGVAPVNRLGADPGERSPHGESHSSANGMCVTWSQARESEPSEPDVIVRAGG